MSYFRYCSEYWRIIPSTSKSSMRLQHARTLYLNTLKRHDFSMNEVALSPQRVRKNCSWEPSLMHTKDSTLTIITWHPLSYPLPPRSYLAIHAFKRPSVLAVRGHVHMTSSKFSGFWTPSLTLSVPNSRNLPSFGQNLADPLPSPHCRRHLYIAPYGAC